MNEQILLAYQNKMMPDSNTKNNEPVKTRSLILFFILFALILFFSIYYFSEIKKEFRLLDKVNIFWLTIAILAQFMTYFFTAVIYRFLSAGQQPKQFLRLTDLIKASVISLFFNQTMPSAGISGNTFFFNFLSGFNIAVTQIITIILAELLIFYTAMEMIILLLLLICLLFYTAAPVFTITLIAGFIVYLVFGLLISLAGKKKSLEFLYQKIQKVKWTRKLFKKIIQRIQLQGISTREVRLSTFIRNNKGKMLNVLFFQLLVITADGFTLYALFNGLGFNISVFIVLLSYISTKIISILPFLPGALVLYESSMSFFFVSLGVPVGTSIIVTLVYRLLSFWFPMPVGLFLYRRWLQKAPDSIH